MIQGYNTKKRHKGANIQSRSLDVLYGATMLNA